MQLHLIFVRIKVINGVSGSVESFNLRHSKFCWKGEVQHLSRERGLSLLHQGVHRDWSSTLYCFLHMAELLLDAPEPLLPCPLPCFLLIEDGYGFIASVFPSMPCLIAILPERFLRITFPSLDSFSIFICSSRRVKVLLLFLGEGV